MKIVDNFPTGFKPRAVQVDLMNQIEEAILSGNRNIVVCAPTGVGKSHIVVALAKAFQNSVILTAQKVLQDQYADEFPFIRTIRGKSNFVCEDITATIPIKTLEEMKKNKQIPYKYSADVGECSRLEATENGHKTVSCPFKGSMEEYMDVYDYGKESEKPVVNSLSCSYYAQKYQGLNASKVLLNYAAYFSLMRGGDKQALANRDVMICDEAHEIEEWLINYVGIEISESMLEQAEVNYFDLSETNIEEIKEMIERMSTDLVARQKAAFDMGERLSKRVERFISKVEYTAYLLRTQEGRENFIIDTEKNVNGTATKMVLKPISVGMFTETFFPQKVRVFVSATINREIFSEMMDLDNRNTAYVEIDDHPFPKENRTVEFLNVAKINSRTSDEEWAKVHGQVDRIMEEHGGEKGLILCTSKAQCHALADGVSAENKDRMVITYGGYGDSKEIVLKNHAKTKRNQVLVAPALWTGCDLKDEQARFLIVLKTPYAYLGDERIKIKTERSQSWYTWQALMKLLQGMGRGVRSDKDYCRIYCMDSSTLTLLRMGRKLLPKAYQDILEVVA